MACSTHTCSSPFGQLTKSSWGLPAGGHRTLSRAVKGELVLRTSWTAEQAVLRVVGIARDAGAHAMPRFHVLAGGYGPRAATLGRLRGRWAAIRRALRILRVCVPGECVLAAGAVTSDRVLGPWPAGLQ